ncbi:hypothetical protein BJX61DRAFT_537289 [Aspergillus egyptiacus]|nr:hypothetical protein BJX61DRAFT_537289 [Aspergillus egyptiacus]
MFNPNPNPNPNTRRYSQLSTEQPRPEPPNPIVIDIESSDNSDSDPADQMELTGATAQHTPSAGFNRRYPSSPHLTPPLSLEQEKRMRSRLREERHASLCVLLDRELLTIQALAAQETLPQTRRRFLAKMLAPSDPQLAASIRADRFTVRPVVSASGYAAEPVLVAREVVDVCETDDAGWWGDSAGPGSGVSTPVGARAMGTPEKVRGKGRTSLGRQQQQQTRERRRRWSGAERQDFGVSMMPP